MSSPLQSLAGIIEGLQAKSVLLCSRGPSGDIQAVCNELHCTLDTLSADAADTPQPPQPRYDLAIVADCLEHLDHAQGERLLGRLRNQHSNHIVVVYRPDKLSSAKPAATSAGWLPQHFFAFAMRHHESFENDEKGCLQLYTYEIESYTLKRDWNNARFWANPENFGRYWW